MEIGNFGEALGEEVTDEGFFGIHQLFLNSYVVFMKGLTLDIRADFLLNQRIKNYFGVFMREKRDGFLEIRLRFLPQIFL